MARSIASVVAALALVALLVPYGPAAAVVCATGPCPMMVAGSDGSPQCQPVVVTAVDCCERPDAAAPADAATPQLTPAAPVRPSPLLAVVVAAPARDDAGARSLAAGLHDRGLYTFFSAYLI